MAFNSDGYSYEMPWRQNFEARATLGYLAGIVAAGVCSVTTPMPAAPFLWMGAFCAASGVWCAVGAYRVWRRVKLLKGYPFSFATVEDMKEKAHDSRHQDEQYIGRGFIWENRHAASGL